MLWRLPEGEIPSSVGNFIVLLELEKKGYQGGRCPKPAPPRKGGGRRKGWRVDVRADRSLEALEHQGSARYSPGFECSYGRPSIERAGGQTSHLSTEIPKAYVPREVQEEAVLTRMTAPLSRDMLLAEAVIEVCSGSG